MHWFNVYISFKASHGIQGSSASSSQLSSLKKLRKKMIYKYNTHPLLRPLMMTLKQNCLEKALTYLLINDMIYLLNKTVKIILSNFVTHVAINCDGRHNLWIEPKNLLKIYITENKDEKLFHKDEYLQNSPEFISWPKKRTGKHYVIKIK